MKRNHESIQRKHSRSGGRKSKELFQLLLLPACPDMHSRCCWHESSFGPWLKPSLRSCTWRFQYLLNCIGLCLNIYCHHCPCLRHRKLYLGVSLKEGKIAFLIKADLLYTPLGSTTHFWKHNHLFLWQSCITPCCLFHVQPAGVVFVTKFFIIAFVTSFYAFGHSGGWDRTCLSVTCLCMN